MMNTSIFCPTSERPQRAGCGTELIRTKKLLRHSSVCRSTRAAPRVCFSLPLRPHPADDSFPGNARPRTAPRALSLGGLWYPHVHLAGVVSESDVRMSLCCDDETQSGGDCPNFLSYTPRDVDFQFHGRHRLKLHSCVTGGSFPTDHLQDAPANCSNPLWTSIPISASSLACRASFTLVKSARGSICGRSC